MTQNGKKEVVLMQELDDEKLNKESIKNSYNKVISKFFNLIYLWKLK